MSYFAKMLNKLMIVLLPGTDGTGFCYQELRKLLERDYECLIIPIPMEGPQDYETLTKEITLKIPSDKAYILIAESFSTPIALLIADSSINKPIKLILAGGFSCSPYPFLKSFLPILEILFNAIKIPKFLISFFLLNGKIQKPHLADELHGLLESIPMKVILSRLRAALECNFDYLLPKIAIPTLFLYPENDRILPDWTKKKFETLVSDIKIGYCKAPHLLFYACPNEAVYKFIIPFLQSQGSSIKLNLKGYQPLGN